MEWKLLYVNAFLLIDRHSEEKCNWMFVWLWIFNWKIINETWNYFYGCEYDWWAFLNYPMNVWLEFHFSVWEMFSVFVAFLFWQQNVLQNCVNFHKINFFVRFHRYLWRNWIRHEKRYCASLCQTHKDQTHKEHRRSGYC